jgi:p-aminobenzoyl-glutamate transporter AbgT
MTMMLPYGVAISVVWILLFLAWELLGPLWGRMNIDFYPLYRAP